MATRMNLTTKEQEQDNLLSDMKREISNGGSPFRTATRWLFSCLD